MTGLPADFDLRSAGQAVATRAAWERQLHAEMMRAMADFLRAVESMAWDVVEDPATDSLIAAGPGDRGNFSLGRVLALWAVVVEVGTRVAAELSGRPTTDPEVSLLRDAIMASEVPAKVYATAKAILTVAHTGRWSASTLRAELRRAFDPRSGGAVRIGYRDLEDPLRGLNIEPELVRLAEWTEQVRGEARTLATRTYNRLLLDTIAAHGEPLTKRWVSHHDERTRASHAAADGQRVQLDSPFMVGGYALQYPGDPQGPAGETIHCRCVMTAWPVDPSLP